MRRSMLVGATLRSPRTTRALLPLSATVSAKLMFQSAIRLSITSNVGAIAVVAASTSATVTPGPGNDAPRRNATSTSILGAISSSTLIAAPSGSTMSFNRCPKSGVSTPKSRWITGLVQPILCPITCDPFSLQRWAIPRSWMRYASVTSRAGKSAITGGPARAQRSRRQSSLAIASSCSSVHVGALIGTSVVPTRRRTC